MHWGYENYKVMSLSNTNLGQQVNLNQIKSYSGNCLPKTAHIASRNRKVLLSKISKQNFPDDWTFEDKILVLICPVLRRQVDLYYSNKGLKMIQIYSEQEIQNISEIKIFLTSTKLHFSVPANIHRILFWSPTIGR